MAIFLITSRRSGAVFIVAERTRSDLAISPTHSGITTSNTQNKPITNLRTEFPYLVHNNQPRSQSFSAISDVTSPVKLVGKVCRSHSVPTCSGNSDNANWPGYEAA